MKIEIDDPMEYRVALYIGLSKENEDPTESIANQNPLLEGIVKEYRLSVHSTDIDDGWGGTSFERPDFQRMIADIEAKKVNMVVTKDLSRLGRNYIMTDICRGKLSCTLRSMLKTKGYPMDRPVLGRTVFLNLRFCCLSEGFKR